MSKKSKKNKSIFSEAFPPNKRGLREKLSPTSSSHSLLEGIEINPNDIIYKPLSKENIQEIIKLHKEWFPIKYSDDFFTKIFDKNYFWYFTIGAFYKNQNSTNNETKEIILGLALCEWVPVDDNFVKHTSKEAAKEICDNINYIEEVQFNLNCCEDYYRCAYIMTIGVLDECRRMNIGSKLVEEINNIALRSNFCVGICLDVVYYNYSAIKFYKKNNFKKVATIKNYYNINKIKYDSYVFLKILTRKEKDEFKEKNMSIFGKIISILIINPIFFVVKIILFILLFQCFRNKIKTE